MRSKLQSEAKAAVGGLETTNENYEVAKAILKDRFGRPQVTIDVHYSKLMELQPSPNYLPKLRALLDSFERHLRSLEALGEDINGRHFISLFMSKLPKDVIIKLEENKGQDEPWSVELLRNKLQCHLAAREAAELHKAFGNGNLPSNGYQKAPYTSNSRSQYQPRTTCETLVSSTTNRSQQKVRPT